MFQVALSQRARKSVKRLDNKFRERIIELLLVFRENPVPSDYYDIVKLKGQTNTYRVRVGDIRIIYEITWETKRVNVLVIERRGRAYSKM